MRMITLAAALAGAVLTLGACSDGADSAANAGGENAVAEPEGNAAAPAQGAGGTAAEAGAPLDANTATAAQLGAVSGLSPEVAGAIAAGRPYASVVDLNAKLGETLPKEAAAAILAKVFVPVNLNKARREEIELIPGMTSKMVGEFLEYRPYENMDEFNREIGKYVDEAEVARFRRYVTL
jgi:DNA uptake protein ComE-like DNA-binding protein